MWIVSHGDDCTIDANIFCRLVAPRRQLLACSMSLSAHDELSLVLPLPVPVGCPAEEIRFVDLDDYPAFFDCLARGSVRYPAGSRQHMLDRVRLPKAPVQVHVCAEFTTSLVDYHGLEQLDPPIRLPEEVCDRFPTYRDYGFVVLRIHGARTRATLSAEVKAARDHLVPLINQLMRPLSRLSISRENSAEQESIDAVSMVLHHVNSLADDLCMRPGLRDIVWFALTFPHRETETLSFPAVQLFDSRGHSKAAVDTCMYCQVEPSMENYLGAWQVSDRPAGAFMPPSEFIDSKKMIYSTRLEGQHRKGDLVIGGTMPTSFVPQVTGTPVTCGKPGCTT